MQKSVHAINLNRIDDSVPGTNLTKKYTSLMEQDTSIQDSDLTQDAEILQLDESDVAKEQRNDPVQSKIIYLSLIHI